MISKDKMKEILNMDPEAQRGLLLMEVYLHVLSVENILIRNGIMTESEIMGEMEHIRASVLAYVKDHPELLSTGVEASVSDSVPIPAPKPTPDRSKN